MAAACTDCPVGDQDPEWDSPPPIHFKTESIFLSVFCKIPGDCLKGCCCCCGYCVCLERVMWEPHAWGRTTMRPTAGPHTLLSSFAFHQHMDINWQNGLNQGEIQQELKGRASVE